MTQKELAIKETEMRDAGDRWAQKQKKLHNAIGESVRELMLMGAGNDEIVEELKDIVETASAQIEEEAVEMGHPR